MTLENCKRHLEAAKARNDTADVKIWTDRIAHKLTKPQYANEVKPNGKKSA